MSVQLRNQIFLLFILQLKTMSLRSKQFIMQFYNSKTASQKFSELHNYFFQYIACISRTHSIYQIIKDPSFVTNLQILTENISILIKFIQILPRNCIINLLTPEKVLNHLCTVIDESNIRNIQKNYHIYQLFITIISDNNLSPSQNNVRGMNMLITAYNIYQEFKTIDWKSLSKIIQETKHFEKKMYIRKKKNQVKKQSEILQFYFERYTFQEIEIKQSKLIQSIPSFEEYFQYNYDFVSEKTSLYYEIIFCKTTYITLVKFETIYHQILPSNFNETLSRGLAIKLINLITNRYKQFQNQENIILIYEIIYCIENTAKKCEWGIQVINQIRNIFLKYQRTSNNPLVQKYRWDDKRSLNLINLKNTYTTYKQIDQRVLLNSINFEKKVTLNDVKNLALNFEDLILEFKILFIHLVSTDSYDQELIFSRNFQSLSLKQLNRLISFTLNHKLNNLSSMQTIYKELYQYLINNILFKESRPQQSITEFQLFLRNFSLIKKSFELAAYYCICQQNNINNFFCEKCGLICAQLQFFFNQQNKIIKVIINDLSKKVQFIREELQMKLEQEGLFSFNNIQDMIIQEVPIIDMLIVHYL